MPPPSNKPISYTKINVDLFGFPQDPPELLGASLYPLFYHHPPLSSFEGPFRGVQEVLGGPPRGGWRIWAVLGEVWEGLRGSVGVPSRTLVMKMAGRAIMGVPLCSPRIGGVWEGLGGFWGSLGGLEVFRTLVMKVMMMRGLVTGVPRGFWGSQGVLGVPQGRAPSRTLVKTGRGPAGF